MQKFHVIYYASHSLNEAQVNHIVTKKENLAVVFGFEKFRPQQRGSHVNVFTNHATLKNLFKKKDVNPRFI